MAHLTHCTFSWDEPDGCTSPRGWMHLENHPDGTERNCCGFYLDYDGCHSSGPNGETILASAYIFQLDAIRHVREYRLGHAWFHTVSNAKDFIENNVRAYFGIAHPSNVYVGAES